LIRQSALYLVFHKNDIGLKASVFPAIGTGTRERDIWALLIWNIDHHVRRAHTTPAAASKNSKQND